MNDDSRIRPEAVPPFVGLFGGGLLAWLIAEAAVRDVPAQDFLHIAIAVVAGGAGWLVGRVWARRTHGASRE